MIALGVVYPCFWVMNPNEMEERFYFYLGMVKAIFCVLCKVGEYGQIVPTLLSS
jgi:hypothetical protein